MSSHTQNNRTALVVSLLALGGGLALLFGVATGRPFARWNDGGRSEATAVETDTREGTSQREAEGEKMSANLNTQHKIEHADEASFNRLVLNSDVPVLVDFYADWCGPCRMLAPTLEEFAKETADAKVVKVDVDDHPALAQRYGISSIPSLIVFKGGQIAARHTGVVGKAGLKELLAR
jgi:thioredoxin 1